MAKVLRLSLIGGMPNGEKWSVNPVFGVGGDFGVPVTQQQAQTIATACAAVVVPSGISTMWQTPTTLTSIRVEARGMDGTLEAQAEALKTPMTSGGGSSTHPFQTSIVTSLRTAHPGPSGRGRLYWPATGIAMTSSTLRAASGSVDGAVTAVKTYLSALEAAIEVTLTGVALCVWSRKNGALYPVNQLQMGDVLDTQRRRRDTTIETFSTVAYT